MLTRDFLQKADCRTSFGCIEERLLLTPQQRAESLEKTLACRPDHGPVWVFGYGSLMWNPVFDAEEACLATLHDWHRSFCLRLTIGRGTLNRPGRMLALIPGGKTTGLAFRLAESSLREDLELLWKREMLTGCYRPGWFELQQPDGDTVTALVFVSDLDHPLLEQDTCIKQVAPLIAQASGPLGTNAQYLFALERELKNYGMDDDGLSELAKQVRALQQATESGNNS